MQWYFYRGKRQGGSSSIYIRDFIVLCYLMPKEKWNKKIKKKDNGITKCINKNENKKVQYRLEFNKKKSENYAFEELNRSLEK